MGYYRGDHYRSRRAGDYYHRGDPGFFSFIGNAIKGVVGGAVKGFLGGGPIGGILGAIKGTVSATQANIAESAPVEVAPYLPPPGRSLALGPGTQVPSIITHSPLGTPVSPEAIQMQLAAHMRRTHPNKSTYVTRGGGTSKWPQQLIVHPKHTEQVTTRRLNVANPRALRRALRRAAGFVKLARRAHVKLAAFHGRGAKKRRK